MVVCGDDDEELRIAWQRGSEFVFGVVGLVLCPWSQMNA